MLSVLVLRFVYVHETVAPGGRGVVDGGQESGCCRDDAEVIPGLERKKRKKEMSDSVDRPRINYYSY